MFFFFIFLFIISAWIFFWWNKIYTIARVQVTDDGVNKVILHTRPGTVCEILDRAKIKINEKDKISPNCSQDVKDEVKITIKRYKKLTVLKNGKETKIDIFGRKTLKEALVENNIVYDENDIISKNLDSLIKNDTKIEIINVTHKTEVENEIIEFKKITKKDKNRQLGYKRIIKEGELGKEKITYNVVYHNGTEFEKKIIAKEIIKEPINQITLIGTYKLGKLHEGNASWYSYKDCNCAAHRYLPIGSRVKVTNKLNGKSVIVTINDRGPFVDDRIIDLSKTSFKKIASIGTGVINVKVEEIIE